MRKLTQKEIEQIVPENIVGVAGVVAAIEAIEDAVKESGLRWVDGSRLSEYIARNIPHVERFSSYHPGSRNQKSYYGSNHYIVEDAPFSKLLEEARELGIKTYKGVVWAATGRNERTAYQIRGGRWVKVRKYRKVSDPDLGHVWKTARAKRVHGWFVERIIVEQAGIYNPYLYRVWDVKKTWCYHVERRKARDVRGAVKLAIRERRKQLDAEAAARAIREKAARVWVTVESSRRAGNCDSGTNYWVAKHGLAGVGAIRGDFLLELEDSPRTRRVLAHAV